MEGADIEKALNILALLYFLSWVVVCGYLFYHCCLNCTYIFYDLFSTLQYFIIKKYIQKCVMGVLYLNGGGSGSGSER